MQAKGLRGVSSSSGPSVGGYAFKLMMEVQVYAPFHLAHQHVARGARPEARAHLPLLQPAAAYDAGHAVLRRAVRVQGGQSRSGSTAAAGGRAGADPLFGPSQTEIEAAEMLFCGVESIFATSASDLPSALSRFASAMSFGVTFRPISAPFRP